MRNQKPIDTPTKTTNTAFVARMISMNGLGVQLESWSPLVQRSYQQAAVYSTMISGRKCQNHKVPELPAVQKGFFQSGKRTFRFFQNDISWLYVPIKDLYLIASKKVQP